MMLLQQNLIINMVAPGPIFSCFLWQFYSVFLGYKEILKRQIVNMGTEISQHIVNIRSYHDWGGYSQAFYLGDPTS